MLVDVVCFVMVYTLFTSANRREVVVVVGGLGCRHRWPLLLQRVSDTRVA